jgi:DNA repair exonuclease SbcCD nuclease subunit
VRIVACSDAHTDARTAGRERFDEVVRNFDEVVRFAIEAKPRVNLFVFLGDLVDPDDGRDVLRAASFAISRAMKLACYGVESLWIAGNHDVCQDGETTVLDPLGEASLGFHQHIFVAAREAFSIGREEVEILALPYSPRPYDAEEVLMSAAAEAKDSDKPLLVFGHLMLPGMHLGSESAELARGKDRSFPLETARKVKPRLMVNGHYHEGQITRDGIHIPGSLCRLTFGEERNEPGYLVFDIGGGGSR